MKAMILAAGLGSRLRPLTNQVPKPMLEVGGKPLLQWHFEKLAAADINEVVVNTSWLASQIEDYFGNGQQYGINIIWSREETPLETGGGVFNALALLGNDPFVLISADIWTDLVFTNELKNTLASANSAHLFMIKNPEHNPSGDFSLINNVVGYKQPRYTYSGISVLSPAIFESLKPTSKKFPLRDVLQPAILASQVSGEVFPGDWCDVGTIERYDNLNRKLRGTSSAAQ
ncbi:nucleotidyltransferase family protein [Gammaproteobacteria bacterium]|jgi:N-acetyl-alpha-D-muramate 1-phosphate uridylyltransferase|nr:nucleotidyltransferase family protein [Gammaproteobacteria bacterium]|tara:strand:- start:530 stop:1219 length:690 start_codon:yes stop_codon:yes gene_type:complete